MRSVWLLLKIQFRSRLNLKDLTTVRSGGKRGAWKRAGVLALFALLAAYLVGIYSYFIHLLLDAAIDFGYPELVMDMVVLLTMVTTAVFGIFITMSGIFLPRDTQLLAGLPIPARHVFLSKFLFVYCGELLVSAIFLIPAIILYAFKVDGALGAGIFLRGLYVTLLSPMIPLVLSTVLVSLLMLIIGKLRRRDLFITIGTFVLIFVVTFGQFFLQSKLLGSGDLSGNLLATLFNTHWTTLNALSKPPFSWASFAIHSGGMSSALNLILFTLAVLFAYVIVRIFCGLIYRYAAAVNQESAKSAKPYRTSNREMRSPRRALLKKEFRIFLRSPVYVTNGLSGVIFPVMIMVFPLFSDSAAVLRQFVKQLSPTVSALMLGGIAVFCAGFSSAAATVLSREGRAYPNLQALPLEPQDFAVAKLWFGLSFCPLWTVPLCVFAVPVFGISIWSALLALVIGLLGSALISAISVWIDFVRPKLHWDTETEAIKQNANVAFSMLLSLAITACLGVGAYLLLAHTAISAPIVYTALTALLTAATMFVASAAVRSGERTFRRLD